MAVFPPNCFYICFPQTREHSYQKGTSTLRYLFLFSAAETLHATWEVVGEEWKSTNIYKFSLSGHLQLQWSQVEEFATTKELPFVAQDNKIIHLSVTVLLQWWCQGGIIIQQNDLLLSLCGTFLSKAVLLYLSLAGRETGMTFKRITLALRNPASTQKTISIHGLKHLCISKKYI